MVMRTHTTRSCWGQGTVLPRLQTLPQRRCVVAKAQDDPRGVLSTCLNLLQEGRVLEMAPYLPSDILGPGLTRLRIPSKRHPNQHMPPDPVIQFQPLVEEVLKQKQTQFMDTYAYRNLLMSTPSYFKEVSSLSIGPDMFISRCLCGSATGEEAVLTFKLKRNKVFAEQPDPDREAHHRVDSAGYSQLNRPLWGPAWRLVAVTGEPMHPVLPRVPSPEFSPESVVQAQLQQLQEFNFAQAFSLLSPTAQDLVGPLDKFIANLSRNRQYRALVHHLRATTVIRYQHGHSTYLEVVRVHGSAAPPSTAAKPSEVGVFHYCWVLSKQQEHMDSPASRDLAHCWLTEWVKVIDDPKLLVSLGRHEADADDEERDEGKQRPRT